MNRVITERVVTRGERGRLTPMPSMLLPTRVVRVRRVHSLVRTATRCRSVPYYEVIVKAPAELDAGTIAAATGLRATTLDGATRLEGELVDQAALHGAIERIHRLGLELLALDRRSSRHTT